MSTTKNIDLVVFGATGFTGKLIADHLLEKYGVNGDVKWAIAGRSQAKLEQVRSDLGASADLAVIVADSNDLESLKAMAKQTKAVITSAGPFQLYGDNLVQACAECGTDYLDLAGEPNWIKKMLDAHESTAKKTGARLLFSAGYDSIPSEIGVWYTQKLAQERYGKPLARVNGRVRVFGGSIGGGSALSGATTRAAVEKDPSIGAQLMNPFLLVPSMEGPAQPPGMEPEDDADLGKVFPFMLAMINSKAVHRANYLLGYPWGEDFQYQEMIMSGPDAVEKFAAQHEVPPPKPGEGPSEEERNNGCHEMVFIGLAENGEKIKVGVRGEGDPGFRSTSRIIAETALCLIETPEVAGGCWTPVSALEQKLFDRLTANADMTIKEES
jgi:short subunit dehydrogenase-like uncharacterized protein